ncbi:MAG: DinB family protein [Chitinophagaceae bacterium]
MNTFFKELFEYNYAMNQQLCALIQENADKISEKSLQLISHILNAHHIWNERITNEKNNFTVWQLHAIVTLKAIDEQNYQKSLSILETYLLNETLSYSNSKGEQFSSRIQDILFHVINHSTYHRAQIASECKQLGITPISTDYIFYKR